MFVPGLSHCLKKAHIEKSSRKIGCFFHGKFLSFPLLSGCRKWHSGF